MAYQLTPKSHKLFIIRHSERIDEVDLEKWCHIVDLYAGPRNKNDYSNDPILTENGLAIATKASLTTHSLMETKRWRITKVYASKLRRAVETAVPIARRLGVPIYVSSGLALTAKAVEERGGHFEFTFFAELQSLYPDVVMVDCDVASFESEAYVPTTHWLDALQVVAERNERSIIVAHRESVRNLAGSMRAPYCCLARFRYTFPNRDDEQFHLPPNDQKVAAAVRKSVVKRFLFKYLLDADGNFVVAPSGPVPHAAAGGASSGTLTQKPSLKKVAAAVSDVDMWADVATVSEKEKTSSVRTHKLMIIRHSERVDEVNPQQWGQIVDTYRGHRNIYDYAADPVLTDNGKEIARDAAATAERFVSQKGWQVDKIYCSKLVRTVQTAYEIATRLNVPLYVSSGLALPAMAVEKRAGAFEFASFAELQRLYPDVVMVDCDVASFESEAYVPTTHWLDALQVVAELNERSIIVAHRESIRKFAGCKIAPYCSFARFRYTLPDEEKKFHIVTTKSSTAAATTLPDEEKKFHIVKSHTAKSSTVAATAADDNDDAVNDRRLRNDVFSRFLFKYLLDKDGNPLLLAAGV